MLCASFYSKLASRAHPAVVSLDRVGDIPGQVRRRPVAHAAAAAGRGAAVAAAAVVAVDGGAAVPRRGRRGQQMGRGLR